MVVYVCDHSESGDFVWAYTPPHVAAQALPE